MRADTEETVFPEEEDARQGLWIAMDAAEGVISPRTVQTDDARIGTEETVTGMTDAIGNYLIKYKNILTNFLFNFKDVDPVRDGVLDHPVFLEEDLGLEVTQDVDLGPEATRDAQDPKIFNKILICMLIKLFFVFEYLNYLFNRLV